jgi:hypothetical protein
MDTLIQIVNFNYIGPRALYLPIFILVVVLQALVLVSLLFVQFAKINSRCFKIFENLLSLADTKLFGVSLIIGNLLLVAVAPKTLIIISLGVFGIMLLWLGFFVGYSLGIISQEENQLSEYED